MQQITVAELRQALHHDDSIRLIDVREPYEHEDFNIGGVNIPLAMLGDNIDQLKSFGEQSRIVLYCQSGNRSGMAQKILSLNFGIENTLNLSGGMSAWKKDM